MSTSSTTTAAAAQSDDESKLLDDARLAAEAERLQSKYGRSLTKEMIRKKLAKKRRYFDSAEYFASIAEQHHHAAGSAPPPTEIPVLHLFKRAPEGFVKHSTTPITTLLAPIAATAASASASAPISLGGEAPLSSTSGLKPPRTYWDSADYSLSLQGFLEYPLGEKPHPVMLLFRQDGHIGIAAHPHSKLGSVSTEAAEVAMSEICEQAEAELRSRYGDNFKLSPAQRLKIKLRGKKKEFDSADWALSLQGGTAND